MTRSRARARWGKPELLQEVGETATCPLMLKATLEPRDSPVQHKKKYANQHWPTEHLNKQPSVIFKVTTIITPTVAIDNQTSWIAFPECPCGPGYRTDNPNMPPVQLLHGSRTSSADATNAGAAGWPRQVRQQKEAKRLIVAFSYSPAPAAYRRSKPPCGLPADLGPAIMFNRQFGG